jgi:UDP-GlcNAc:undecaprenyl-phosphate GlcNAc-1-phosphate transferase
MTTFAALQHAAFAGTLMLLSWGVTYAMIGMRIMDVPNGRSSHTRPTPRGGGVGIVIAFAVGLATLWFVAISVRLADPFFLGLMVGASAIAIVSFLDDLRPTPLVLRFGAQLIGTSVALWCDLVLHQVWLPVIGRVELGWFGYVLSAIWIVGMTNAINFMDGLDGLVAGSTLIASVGFAIVAFLSGSHFAYLAAVALAAGIAGFLPHNFPPARIFMGDVGSQFLGFTLAVLGMVAAQFDAQRTSFMIVPILVFAFLFDSGVTVIRRLFAGEKLTQAHRGHLYQVLNRAGWSHIQVSGLYAGFALVQLVAAVAVIYLPPDAKILVFVPLLALQLVHFANVVKVGRRGKVGRW